MKKSVMMILVMVTPLLMASTSYEKAIQLYKQKNFNGALGQFEQTIKENPDWYPAVMLKGQCNFKLKKYKEALRDFNDALTLEVPSKEIPQIKYYVAKSYMGLQEFDKAIHAFSELIPQAPKTRHFDLYFNRAQCELSVARHFENKDNAKSLERYKNVLVSLGQALKNPVRDTNLINRATFQKAQTQFKIASLGNDAKMFAQSMSSCAVAIKNDNQNKDAHQLLVNLSFKMIEQSKGSEKVTNYRKAVTHIDGYLKNWPNDYAMMRRKGNALQGAKDFGAAISVFEDVVKGQPDHGKSWYSLASCQYSAKQYNKAIRSFEKAMNLGEKTNPQVYLLSSYSMVKQKSNCYDRDIPIYEKAIALLEKGAKNTGNHAKIQKDLEQKRNSLSTLRANLETDNNNHKATIENITALMNGLAKNKDTLRENQGRYLEQPTEELLAAINEGKANITKDTASLETEVKSLNKYIRDAKKCGGSKSFDHYNEMTALSAKVKQK